MAYRIDPGQPVGAEVRRILGEQLRRAADDLARPGDGQGAEAEGAIGPDPEAVHSARKRIKKARSLLRLARAGLGATVVSHAQGELRECADRLAPQREADAAVEVATWLELAAHRARRRREAEGEADDAAAETTAGAWWLLEFLQTDAERRQARGALTWRSARSVALRLVRTADWIERVPDRIDGWAALEPGLQRQYGRGRDRLAGMPEDPTVEELHEWRKRVKDLGYHTRLLRNLWPEVLKPMQEAAGELADALGADHDLGLLLGRLSADRDVDHPPGERAPEHREFLQRLDVRLSSRPHDAAPHEWSAAGLDPAYEPLDALQTDHRRYLRALIASERAELQAEARRLGAQLFVDRSGAVARRYRAWWLLAEPAPTEG